MESRKTVKPFAPALREGAVGMVREHREAHGSQWAAIRSVAAEIGRRASSRARSSRPSTRAGPRRGWGSSRARSADRHARPSGTPSVSPRRASSPRWARDRGHPQAEAPARTPARPLARPRAGRVRRPRTEGPRAAANGWAGSTTAGSSGRSATPRPPRPSTGTTRRSTRPPWPRRSQTKSLPEKPGRFSRRRRASLGRSCCRRATSPISRAACDASPSREGKHHDSFGSGKTRSQARERWLAATARLRVS